MSEAGPDRVALTEAIITSNTGLNAWVGVLRGLQIDVVSAHRLSSFSFWRLFDSRGDAFSCRQIVSLELVDS